MTGLGMVVELANDAKRSQGHNRGAACVPKRKGTNASEASISTFWQSCASEVWQSILVLTTGQTFFFWLEM